MPPYFYSVFVDVRHALLLSGDRDLCLPPAASVITNTVNVLIKPKALTWILPWLVPLLCSLIVQQIVHPAKNKKTKKTIFANACGEPGHECHHGCLAQTVGCTVKSGGIFKWQHHRQKVRAILTRGLESGRLKLLSLFFTYKSPSTDWRNLQSHQASAFEIPDVPGDGTGWFSRLSSQSASGSDSVGTHSCLVRLVFIVCAHRTYFSFCCTSYVSQGCVTPPLPDTEWAQRQKVRFIGYLFADPDGIHIKPGSTVTRFPTVRHGVRSNVRSLCPAV